jgi:hypothetical protein
VLSAPAKNPAIIKTPEYEHHYYAAYIPNTNTGVSVQRNQAALIKFPVQFYSSFTREYDAVAQYAIVTTGISNPAVLGQDFNIVDRNGNVIQATDGKYSMVFPQAKRAMDTIYVKLLNSAVPGTRRMEVQLLHHITDKYQVDTFSTAFRRPVEIK